MPIFQVTPERQLRAIQETTFGAEGLMERKDLQRYLREQIAALDERLMVVAEEFGDWLDSSRRVDLLCIDADANLVVVELKRTEDGGHMELQALRYAAMVSAMTFKQLVETFARYKNKAQPDVQSAQQEVMKFLNWDEVQEEQFAQDTKIVLAAADFSKELTTTVMWLIDRGLDIRCIRIKPYRMSEGTLLLDIQQLIPLREAADFQTQLGVKKQAERQSRSDRSELLLKFWGELLEIANSKLDTHIGRAPTTDHYLSASIGCPGFSLVYVTRRSNSQVELWIGFGTGQAARNKAAFKALKEQKEDIEADFGEKLDWQELNEKEGCRICRLIEGGYKTSMDQWPLLHAALTDAMLRMYKTFRPRVLRLTF